MTTKFAAILEQAGDSTWSAYSLTPSLVTGTGPTREAALADLRTAISFWLDFMKETGQPIPSPQTELVTVEVAA